MCSIKDSHDKGKRIPPARAISQRDFILSILRRAGASGVSKIHFLHGTGPCNGRMVSQVSARINELERENYRFEHRHVPGSEFVTFAIISEPNPQSTEQTTKEAQLRLDMHA